MTDLPLDDDLRRAHLSFAQEHERLREELLAALPAEAPWSLDGAESRRRASRWTDGGSSLSSYAVLLRRYLMRPIPRYTTLSAVAVALLVVVAVWFRPVDLGASLAFADVQEAIRQVHSAVVDIETPGWPWMSHKVLYRRDCDVVRAEWPSGAVTLYDSKQQRELLLYAGTKTARIAPGASGVGTLHLPREATGPREFLDRLAGIEKEAVERLPDRQLDGRRLIGFALPPDEIVVELRMLPRVWVDPQTRLPVRYELVPEDKTDFTASFRHTIETFRFNEPLDPSLFATTLPAGYTLLAEDTGYEPPYEYPPLPKDRRLASPRVVPGVGIGQARFGMGLQEVLEVLGRPDDAGDMWEYTAEERRQSEEVRKNAEQDADQKGLIGAERRRFVSRRINQAINKLDFTRRRPTGINLRYLSRGFELIIGKDQGLVRIFCFSDPFSMRPFTGKTSQGIGMGATEEEIKKAYGKPDARSDTPPSADYARRRTALYYKSLQTLFHLRDGRLWELSLDKP